MADHLLTARRRTSGRCRAVSGAAAPLGPSSSLPRWAAGTRCGCPAGRRLGAGSGSGPGTGRPRASNATWNTRRTLRQATSSRIEASSCSDANSSSISTRMRSVGDTRRAPGVGPLSCFSGFEGTYARCTFTPGTGRHPPATAHAREDVSVTVRYATPDAGAARRWYRSSCPDHLRTGPIDHLVAGCRRSGVGHISGLYDHLRDPPSSIGGP